MNIKYLFFVLLFPLLYLANIRKTETITYFSTERPVVYWYDKKALKNLTLLSKRLSRRDPKYYVEVYVHTLFTVTNNLTMDFYFYQLLTNRYRPSFVEMHFKFCDMVHYDTLFGQAVLEAAAGLKCPVSPGIYDLKNMSIAFVPKNFPFTKGRIYCNASLTENGVTRVIGRSSIDMELKVAKIEKN